MGRNDKNAFTETVVLEWEGTAAFGATLGAGGDLIVIIRTHRATCLFSAIIITLLQCFAEPFPCAGERPWAKNSSPVALFPPYRIDDAGARSWSGRRSSHHGTHVYGDDGSGGGSSSILLLDDDLIAT